MMGTMNCVYETPCGWCSKWDKKCDRQIGYDNTKEEFKRLMQKSNEDILSGKGLSKL